MAGNRPRRTHVEPVPALQERTATLAATVFSIIGEEYEDEPEAVRERISELQTAFSKFCAASTELGKRLNRGGCRQEYTTITNDRRSVTKAVREEVRQANAFLEEAGEDGFDPATFGSRSSTGSSYVTSQADANPTEHHANPTQTSATDTIAAGVAAAAALGDFRTAAAIAGAVGGQIDRASLTAAARQDQSDPAALLDPPSVHQSHSTHETTASGLERSADNNRVIEASENSIQAWVSPLLTARTPNPPLGDTDALRRALPTDTTTDADRQREAEARQLEEARAAEALRKGEQRASEADRQRREEARLQEEARAAEARQKEEQAFEADRQREAAAHRREEERAAEALQNEAERARATDRQREAEARQREEGQASEARRREEERALEADRLREAEARQLEEERAFEADRQREAEARQQEEELAFIRREEERALREARRREEERAYDEALALAASALEADDEAASRNVAAATDMEDAQLQDLDLTADTASTIRPAPNSGPNHNITRPRPTLLPTAASGAIPKTALIASNFAQFAWGKVTGLVAARRHQPLSTSTPTHDPPASPRAAADPESPSQRSALYHTAVEHSATDTPHTQSQENDADDQGGELSLGACAADFQPQLPHPSIASPPADSLHPRPVQQSGVGPNLDPRPTPSLATSHIHVPSIIDGALPIGLPPPLAAAAPRPTHVRPAIDGPATGTGPTRASRPTSEAQPAGSGQALRFGPAHSARPTGNGPDFAFRPEPPKDPGSIAQPSAARPGSEQQRPARRTAPPLHQQPGLERQQPAHHTAPHLHRQQQPFERQQPATTGAASARQQPGSEQQRPARRTAPPLHRQPDLERPQPARRPAPLLHPQPDLERQRPAHQTAPHPHQQPAFERQQPAHGAASSLHQRPGVDRQRPVGGAASSFHQRPAFEPRRPADGPDPSSHPRSALEQRQASYAAPSSFHQQPASEQQRPAYGPDPSSHQGPAFERRQADYEAFHLQPEFERPPPVDEAAQPFYRQPEFGHPQPAFEPQRPAYGAAPPHPQRPSDAATVLAKQQLLNQPIAKFSGPGEEFRFRSWRDTITSRLSRLPFEPIEVIDILRTNTTGAALATVNTFHAACGADPDMAVRMIWDALEDRFGSPTRVAAAITRQLQAVPPVRSGTDCGPAVRRLHDACMVALAHSSSCPDLGDMNLPRGQRIVLDKLPEQLISRWRKRGLAFKATHQSAHPPFSVLTDFLGDMATELCCESFMPTQKSHAAGPTQKSSAAGQAHPVSHVLVTGEPKPAPPRFAAAEKGSCSIHPAATHHLHECHRFRQLPVSDRKAHARDAGRCFRCLGRHLRRTCQSQDRCDSCQSDHHAHLCDSASRTSPTPAATTTPATTPAQSTATTLACADASNSTTFSKTLLVDVHASSSPRPPVRCYAILDDQSTSTFAAPELFQALHPDAPAASYAIRTLAGLRTHHDGRLSSDLVVRGASGSTLHALPQVFESGFIPDTSREAASPRDVARFPHLAEVAQFFEERDHNATVLLLIGRNAGAVLSSVQHGSQFPFAQQTPLGWALIGGSTDGPAAPPAADVLHVQLSEQLQATRTFPQVPRPDCFCREDPIFACRADDEMEGTSADDDVFFRILEEGRSTRDDGGIRMPLPFRPNAPPLPDNRLAVFYRTLSTLSRLRSDHERARREACVAGMAKSLAKGHVVRVPRAEESPPAGLAYWLPTFPVTQPRKDKHRLVLDASARFQQSSLNDHLLQGPDLNNALRGVLLRFRRGATGFIADVDTMFHAFAVDRPHQDYLRFYWFADNDPAAGLVQYRATTHILGCRSSPAVAIFGLRYAADCAQLSPEASSFIKDNFYVDDGLGSADSPEEAVRILTEAVAALAAKKIRLHKIVATHQAVLAPFSESERACTSVDLTSSAFPSQRALGVRWEVQSDRFVVEPGLGRLPPTLRGVLAAVGGLYDPLGFVTPVALAGRLLQRRAFAANAGPPRWDEPLNADITRAYSTWLSGLSDLPSLAWPRHLGLSPDATSSELHVFADASTVAIGYVVYARTTFADREPSVVFVAAGAKLAPRSSTTVPRLELCAALEAAKAAQALLREIRHQFDRVCYYCDSDIAIGHISNDSRRFSRYVARRAAMIRQLTNGTPWTYIRSENNPADLASRPSSPASLAASRWIPGPRFLHLPTLPDTPDRAPPATLPEELPEIDIRVLTTSTTASIPEPIFGEVFTRVSKWRRMVRIAARVLRGLHAWLARAAASRAARLPAPEAAEVTRASASRAARLPAPEAAESVLIRDAQLEHFPDSIHRLRAGQPLLARDRLLRLNPYLDQTGTLRVGGRRHLDPYGSFDTRHPILLPDSPAGRAMVRCIHARAAHQGRHVTLGAVRAAGFFPTKNRIVRTVIGTCATCRRLRASPKTQKMADLPPDRLDAPAAFTAVGADAFGPFLVARGRATRSAAGCAKTWGILFTCLASRAVHIELVDSMDASALRLALRRLVAVRGPVSLVRSDRGTNFAAVASAPDSLDIGPTGETCRWELNPAAAPHTGGVWERQVGLVKQALAGCLASTAGRFLTGPEFHTLLLEAAAIVNRTPLWSVQTDPGDPSPLCPENLMTLKPTPTSTIPNLSPHDLLAHGPKRWRRVQALADHFWTQWRRSYLTDLHLRSKWLRPARGAAVGDVVLLREPATKRSEWPFAIVTEVLPGSDGLIRKVALRVPNRQGTAGEAGQFIRHVSQIVLLQAAGEATADSAADSGAEDGEEADTSAGTGSDGSTDKDDEQAAVGSASTSGEADVSETTDPANDESDDSDDGATTEDEATDDRRTAFDAAATARADARASATPAARPPAAVAPRPTRTKRRPDRLDL